MEEKYTIQHYIELRDRIYSSFELIGTIKSMPGSVEYFLGWLKERKGNFLYSILAKYINHNGLWNSNVEEVPLEIYNDIIIDGVNIMSDYIEQPIEKLAKDIESKNNIFNECTILYNQIRNRKSLDNFILWTNRNHETAPLIEQKNIAKMLTKESDLFKEIQIQNYKNWSGTFSFYAKSYFDSLDNNGRYKFDVEGIPKELITSFHQYLLFFNEYIKKTKNDDVKMKVEVVETSLVIFFHANNKERLQKIKNYLNEYISFAKLVVLEERSIDTILDQLKIAKSTALKLRIELDSLNNKIEIFRLEKKQLERNRDFLEKLILKMADKPEILINRELTNSNKKIMKIGTQNNYNSNVQNADTIIISSKSLTEADRRFLDLIHTNTQTEEERHELIKNLENYKSENSKSTKKLKAKELLQRFFESGVLEAGKKLGNDVIELGFEYFV